MAQLSVLWALLCLVLAREERQKRRGMYWKTALSRRARDNAIIPYHRRCEYWNVIWLVQNLQENSRHFPVKRTRRLRRGLCVNYGVPTLRNEKKKSRNITNVDGANNILHPWLKDPARAQTVSLLRFIDHTHTHTRLNKYRHTPHTR